MPPTRGDDMTCRLGQHSLVLVMPNARCATYTTRVWWAQSLPRPARLHTLVWRVAAARSPFVTQHTPILMDVVCGHDRVAWSMTHSAHTVLVWRVAILPLPRGFGSTPVGAGGRNTRGRRRALSQNGPPRSMPMPVCMHTCVKYKLHIQRADYVCIYAYAM